MRKRAVYFAILLSLVLWMFVSPIRAGQDIGAEALTGGGTSPWALDRVVTGGSDQDDSCPSASCVSYDALADGDTATVYDYANEKLYHYAYHVPASWQASTAYSLGDRAAPTTDNGYWYEVTTAGTSGTTEPTWPTTPGNTVTDGTVTWTCRDEDSPRYIQPDYAEAVGTPTNYNGPGRWFLSSMVASSLEITTSSGSTGELRLPEDPDNGSNYVGWKAPSSITSDQLWTLPSADGNADEVMKTNGAGVLSFGDPLWEAELDSEAELEAQLTDVTNVYTNNDGALTDDDVTLADVQAATTNDFHNIGGTDDDVPESGDFGAAADLDASGAIVADAVGLSELDDGTDTPAANEILTVDPADTTQVAYVALAGDVTGTVGATVVGDDSHSHTSATLPATTSYLGSSIDLGGTAGLGETTNDLDPDRLAGDTTDDDTIDEGIIDSAITRDTEWPSATATLTNKTLDANGTGNVISNIDEDNMLNGSDIVRSAIEFVIDGGGSAITTGVKGDIEIPFNCTIKRVTLLADQTGSIQVDLWVDTYANFPPTDLDSITASAVPAISSATKYQDSTLTGWTTALTAGAILRYNVDSATTITRVTVSLLVEK